MTPQPVTLTSPADQDLMAIGQAAVSLTRARGAVNAVTCTEAWEPSCLVKLRQGDIDDEAELCDACRKLRDELIPARGAAGLKLTRLIRRYRRRLGEVSN